MYFRSIACTVCANRNGSAQSTFCSPGHPVLTLQYEQARVHVSPRIMKVAVRRSQQSPIFGHAASSQTVCNAEPRNRFLRSV